MFNSLNDDDYNIHDIYYYNMNANNVVFECWEGGRRGKGKGVILVRIASVIRVELVYKLVLTNTLKNFRLQKSVEFSTFLGLNTSFD